MKYDDEETTNPEFGEHEEPSKSQLKRESHDLQDLGELLVELPESKLREMPMWDELRDAVGLGRRLQRGARKRQLKFIGKLLRNGDPEPIREAVARLEQKDAAAIARHHLAERWRERLIEEGDTALAEFLDSYPALDRQHLRHLARNALTERRRNAPPRAARELFRLIRDTMAAAE